MLKLYKRIKRVLHYHEAWVHGSKITEHWGKVGERGETAEHKRTKKLSDEQNLSQVLSKPLSEGYEPIADDDHAVLLIEYVVDGMGNTKDLDKRHALEDRMNETLGWTGLGHCDGGSIGSGTMEVCCFVVDFKIAKRVIEEDLKNTKFADYSRIFDERDAESGVASGGKARPAAQGPEMLAPPWIMFEDMGRRDAGWKKGKAAKYLAKWAAWYRNIPVEGRAMYATVFQEPRGWSGFYKSHGVAK
jgi:hypothetical protein